MMPAMAPRPSQIPRDSRYEVHVTLRTISDANGSPKQKDDDDSARDGHRGRDSSSGSVAATGKFPTLLMPFSMKSAVKRKTLIDSATDMDSAAAADGTVREHGTSCRKAGSVKG